MATAPFLSPRDEKVVRVWDLEADAVRTFGPVPGAGEGFVGAVRSLGVFGTYQLVASVEGYGLLRFDLRTGSQLVLTRELDRLLASSPATGSLLACRYDRLKEICTPVRLDLDQGAPMTLTTHGHECSSGAFDPSGTLIATGSQDGTVRVGRASGGEPHVLLGHKGPVVTVAFSPDGRWLASADSSGLILLWPVPDVSRTPLHLRPHEELMAALRTHTNLRAVDDPQSSTGYKLEPGPFPGWAKPPEW